MQKSMSGSRNPDRTVYCSALTDQPNTSEPHSSRAATVVDRPQQPQSWRTVVNAGAKPTDLSAAWWERHKALTLRDSTLTRALEEYEMAVQARNKGHKLHPGVM